MSFLSPMRSIVFRGCANKRSSLIAIPILTSPTSKPTTLILLNPDKIKMKIKTSQRQQKAI
jgi:hypothetical protein